MISDAEIKSKGIKALLGALGPQEASRFLEMADRTPLDYTEWRHSLFEGMTVEEISEKAMEVWNENRKNERVS